MATFKATPRGILNGVRDLSKRAPVPSPELVPTHFPYVPILAERGDEVPRYAIGDAFTQLYGAETADLKSIYATHQTVMALHVMGNGNAIMAKRLRPANAATAFLRISLEVIRTRLKKYNRNPDGTFQTDANGNYVPETADGTATGTPTGATVEGFRCVWHVGHDTATWLTIAGTDTSLFGNGKSISAYRTGSIIPSGSSGQTLSAYDGTTIGTTVATSTLYPVMDLEVSSFGDYGNNCGFRLDAPSALSAQPGNVAQMEAVNAFLFRVMCLEKEDQTTPTIVSTLKGDVSLDMSLRAETYDSYGNDISMTSGFIPAYRNLNADGVIPSLGVFGRIKVYDTYITEVLTNLMNGVAAQGDIPAAPGEASFDLAVGRIGNEALSGHPERLYMLNAFTGVDPTGRNYESIETYNSVRMGGVAFGPSATFYATGGSDGLANTGNPAADRLANLKIYDDLVKADATNWGVMGTPLASYLDDAQFPCSHIWDTGFSVATKKALIGIMGRRPDIAVRVATQPVADYADALDPTTWGYVDALNEADEQSIGTTLKMTIALYPESAIFGTPACRASVFGHAAKLADGSWPYYILPLTVEMADKYSKAYGASNGVWDASQMPDLPDNNIVNLFSARDVNNTWKPATVYDTDWSLGINNVRFFDMNRLFFPAYKTAYLDDTSVLNDDITVEAVIEIEKICQRTWRRLTGRQLPNAVFIDESNKIIREQTQGRFADRFTIIPNTYLTGGDIQRGFTWSCEVNLYAAKAKSAGTFTINSRRIEDLTATA